MTSDELAGDLEVGDCEVGPSPPYGIADALPWVVLFASVLERDPGESVYVWERRREDLAGAWRELFG